MIRYFKILLFAVAASLLFSTIAIYYDYYLKKSNSGCGDNLRLINIYYSKWPGFMLVELANELGYFKEECIKIKRIEASTVPLMYGMFRNGTLDAAGEVIVDLYTKTRNSINPVAKVVLVTDYSKGADAIIKRKSAPSLFDDIPKTFAGAEDYSFFVPYALDKLRASTNSIKYVQLKDEDDEINQIISGKVDYLVTYEPYLSKALSGGAEMVYSSGDDTGVVLDGIMFNVDFINKHPDIIYAFTKAYFKAYDTWKSSPEESYEQVADYLQSEPSSIQEQMKNIVMLDLNANIDSMSTKQGLLSVYNNLQEARLFENDTNDNNRLNVTDMVYPDAVRKFKRLIESVP